MNSLTTASTRTEVPRQGSLPLELTPSATSVTIGESGLLLNNVIPTALLFIPADLSEEEIDATVENSSRC